MAAIRPTWTDNGVGALAGGIPRLGPQSERSSAWINRDGEVQPPTEREVKMRCNVSNVESRSRSLSRTAVVSRSQAMKGWFGCRGSMTPLRLRLVLHLVRAEMCELACERLSVGCRGGDSFD